MVVLDIPTELLLVVVFAAGGYVARNEVFIHYLRKDLKQLRNRYDEHVENKAGV